MERKLSPLSGQLRIISPRFASSDWIDRTGTGLYAFNAFGTLRTGGNVDTMHVPFPVCRRATRERIRTPKNGLGRMSVTLVPGRLIDFGPEALKNGSRC
ncbi:hypothetical protein Trydic_g21904 [Trypoxylus dichotomus]